MTSAQVRAELGRGRSTVVVPFGAVEQHGPHLPLDTDAVLADRLGPLLAERLHALCAPTIRIGCSQHHLAFAGTLSLRPQTLQMIVHDLVDSLVRHGFRRVVLLATHGGNEPPLQEAGAASRRDGVKVVVPSLRAAVGALLGVARARGVPPGEAGGHAGELETSLMLALAPDLVRRAAMTDPGYTGRSTMRRRRSSSRTALVRWPPTACSATPATLRATPDTPTSPPFSTPSNAKSTIAPRATGCRDPLRASLRTRPHVEPPRVPSCPAGGAGTGALDDGESACCTDDRASGASAWRHMEQRAA
jgi:creatinine amidohydrolase/Fe(II)-dependent formamide hydrolase-like protein